MERRKICVFSGKRGGFGAYIPLMRLIEKDPGLQLQILLGDMHASSKFGKTADEARKFFPKAKLEVIKIGAERGDSPLIRAENLGECLKKLSAILKRLAPDIVMVHGDRGEHLMAAFAALNLGISVAHTQGGEVSGNIDDTQRHAITKLAHIHFPETKEAGRRIEKLGEERWRIHPAGSVYIDRIAKKMYTVLPDAKKKYGLEPNEDYAIFLFHPDTFETPVANYAAAKNILEVLGALPMRTIVLYPCSDPGHDTVIRAVREGEKKFKGKFLVYKNIENLDFLGLMSGAKFITGNSSSALVEAPYFKLPAINVGRRQIGRDREENVIDAGFSKKSIKKAIDYAMNDKHFWRKLARCGRRLGDGKASEKILKILKAIKIDEKLLRKKLA